MKIAMCAYYQGDMVHAIEMFNEIVSYLKGYD